MAKSSDELVLAALKTAVEVLPNLLELVGAKGKGLFTKAQTQIAEGAVNSGFFKAHTVKGKKKTDTKVYAIITEAGARKLAESGVVAETRQTLEALKGALERMGGNHSATDATAFRSALESATATCVQTLDKSTAQQRQLVEAANSACVQAISAASSKLQQAVETANTTCVQAISAAYEKLQKAVEKATSENTKENATAYGKLQQTIEKAADTGAQATQSAFAELRQAVLATVSQPATSTDPAPVLSALTAALGRLNVGAKPVEYPEISKLLAPPPVAPPAPPAVPAVPSTDPARVADAIVEFVTDWARERTVGPPFDAIMKHLRGLFPHITPGEFHDTLRRLASANPPRLKLSGWSKTIHELPEPELALFIKHTVTYYAHPVA